MKSMLSLICACALVACGGNAPVDAPVSLSTSTAVPCEQSPECVARTARGEVIDTCAETYFGKLVYSSWDFGKTWKSGNCDMTAPAGI